MDIAKLDRFMQARPAPEEGVRWLAPFEPPLVLEGFAFFEQDGAYRRLPLDSDAVFSRAGRAALREKGALAARLLQEAAAANGICLKLNRKKK